MYTVMDFPELTPYQFASNNPVFNIDIDGLEGMGSPMVGVWSPSTRKYMIQGDVNNDMVVDESEREAWNKAMSVWLIGGGAVLTGGRTAPLLRPLFWSAVANQETAGTIGFSIFTGLTGYEGPGIPGPGDETGRAINKISKPIFSSFKPIVQKRKELSKAWGVAADYIEYSKQVFTQDLDEEMELIQYRIIGNEGTIGNYFALPGTTPEQIGLKTSDVAETLTVKIAKSTKALTSTHKKDIPHYKDGKTPLEGGGLQIFSAELKKNVEIINRE